MTTTAGIASRDWAKFSKKKLKKMQNSIVGQISRLIIENFSSLFIPSTVFFREHNMAYVHEKNHRLKKTISERKFYIEITFHLCIFRTHFCLRHQKRYIRPPRSPRPTNKWQSWWQVSWLVDLDQYPPSRQNSGIFGYRLPTYSCEGSHGIILNSYLWSYGCTVFPFDPW